MSADGSSFSFDFHELVVDSFAGGGGASTGIFMALGRHPDVAVNHDGEALAMHAANHPTTEHIREDVWAINPEAAMGYRQVGLLWASPDCKHFSKAKGGKPVSKKIRGLAWVVTKWAAKVRPRVICMENVEEFRTWGPLLRNADGDWHPDPARKGDTFKRFLARLEKLGYKVEHRELRASHYGVPTIRKRLYLIARRDGLPIVWPAATHGDPKSLPVQAGKLLPWRTAAECIDWTLPCPSIFERKKPLAEATMKRIAKGIQRYVIDAAEPFIVSAAHGDVSPSGVKRWGSGVRGLDQPLPTVLAGGSSSALIVPHITKYHGESAGSSIESPLPTVTSNSFHKRPGGNPPMALVETQLAPFITEHANASHQRNMPADEPLRTQVAQVKGGHFAAVAATLVQTGYGEREGQEPRALDIEKPLGTVVGGGAKHALVSAFLAQHNTMPNGGVHPGRDPREPLSTVISTGSQQALVTSHLAKLRGGNTGQPSDEPLHTISAQGTHHAEVRAFLVAYYGNDKDGQGLTDPLRTMPTKDRFGLVTVHGVDYQIVDIGMRMLTPRELANAQGFPRDYVIDRGADDKPLTKTAQVRMIGNSVCPPVAAAIVRANFQHEQAGAGRRRRAA